MRAIDAFLWAGAAAIVLILIPCGLLLCYAICSVISDEVRQRRERHRVQTSIPSAEVIHLSAVARPDGSIVGHPAQDRRHPDGESA